MAVSIVEIIASRQPDRSRARKRRPRVLRPVRGRRVDEIIYRKDLQIIVLWLMDATAKLLVPMLHRRESEFLLDSLDDDIKQAMAGIRSQFTGLEAYAEAKATGMVERMDRAHQRRFFKQMTEVAGVNLEGVVQSERLELVLKSKINENTRNIVSIASKHLDELETLVYESTIQGRTSAVSLEKAIFDLGAKTMARAKFIARDQTAKTNSAIHTARSMALGIEEYVWHATGGKSGDGRTRKNHREKHGNVYRYDSPPADTGHPGEDFQCRCTAHSIIPGE